MGQLDGKVAIVTGAAQGIGNAIAHGLAAEGPASSSPTSEAPRRPRRRSRTASV